MATRPFDPVQEITSSFGPLSRNPLLLLPNIVAFLVPAILIMVFGGFALVGGLMSPSTLMNPGALGGIFTPTLFVGFGLAVLVGIVLSLIATGATYGGAADVLQGRTVDVSSLIANGMKYAASIFVYGLILAVVGILAELVVFLLGAISHGILGVLAGLVLFVAAIYVGFLLLYGFAALVVGGKGPIDAMRESAELARANVGPTVMVILAAIVIFIIAAIVNAILGFIPFLGFLISIAIQGICSAFIALVSVKFYMLLSGRISSTAATAPSMPSPPMAPPPPSPPMAPPPPSS
jgi:hypothetical protein